MKKVLFITAFCPTKRTGGQNYSRLLLKDLSAKNTIDVIMFMNQHGEEFDLPDSNTVVKKIFYVNSIKKLLNVLFLPFLFPFFVCRFNFVYLYQIKKILKQDHYDFIYLDFSQIFIYGLFFRKYKKVLMSHDVISQKYQRRLYKPFSLFCFYSEALILKCQTKKKIFTFSSKDSLEIRNRYGIESSPTNFYLENLSNAKIEKLHQRIVLFGSWKRMENKEGLVWFLKNVYPEINKNIEIIIIGGGLEGKDIIQYDNIHYLGFVDDPYQIIAESKLLVAPIFQGAGVKVKVVEALAVGCHVVGTDVALEGIPEIYSSFLFQANTKEDFAKIINEHETTIETKKDFANFFNKTYTKKLVVRYINSN